MSMTSSEGMDTSIEVEGCTSFTGKADDSFYYTLTSDEIDTHIELQSKRSRLRWGIRVTDDTIKSFGPAGIEIPRVVVISFLKETLVGAAGPHSLLLEQHDDTQELKLVLRFSAVYSPTYTFPLSPVEVSPEEMLRASIRDLREDMGDMKDAMHAMHNITEAQDNAASAMQQQVADLAAQVRTLQSTLAAQQITAAVEKAKLQEEMAALCASQNALLVQERTLLRRMKDEIASLRAELNQRTQASNRCRALTVSAGPTD